MQSKAARDKATRNGPVKVRALAQEEMNLTPEKPKRPTRKNARPQPQPTAPRVFDLIPAETDSLKILARDSKNAADQRRRKLEGFIAELNYAGCLQPKKAKTPKVKPTKVATESDSSPKPKPTKKTRTPKLAITPQSQLNELKIAELAYERAVERYGLDSKQAMALGDKFARLILNRYDVPQTDLTTASFKPKPKAKATPKQSADTAAAVAAHDANHGKPLTEQSVMAFAAETKKSARKSRKSAA